MSPLGGTSRGHSLQRGPFVLSVGAFGDSDPHPGLAAGADADTVPVMASTAPTIVGLDMDRVTQLVSADTDPGGPFNLPDALLMLGGLIARYHDKFEPNSYGGAGRRVHKVTVDGGAPVGSSEWWSGSIKVRLEGDYGYDTPTWWSEGHIDADGHYAAEKGFN